MGKKLFVVLADSDLINEEELKEAGIVVSFDVRDSVSPTAEQVLGEAKASNMCVEIHIYTANKRLVEINSGASLEDIM
ncbi:MAG TPA: hypothetical protein PLR64_01140 [Candidatus Dojkabacteria bacterium]|nr:hypothetical protein [Candidatus Dojkabacteria bacterium]HRZ19120.1 hypothetical protein [Methanofastidiosum sp.]